MMNLKASHLWRMISHDSHEFLWQKIKITAHHLFLILFFSISNLILIYFFQFCHFDVCTSINVSFLLKKNANILKSFYDSFLLWVVKKNSCEIAKIVFDQIYIISHKSFAQIWKDFIIKISAENKIKYQIIKHTN